MTTKAKNQKPTGNMILIDAVALAGCPQCGAEAGTNCKTYSKVKKHWPPHDRRVKAFLITNRKKYAWAFNYYFPEGITV